MKGKKVIMTPEQERWMVAHFKHTKNDEIMERFGWSHSALHRFARKLGGGYQSRQGSNGKAN